MNKKAVKTVAAAAVFAFGLTVLPSPALAVSTNIVAETEGKTTLTVSQIQDLAVIYNDTVDSLELQMKQIENQEMMARNEKRSIENSLRNMGSADMGDSTSQLAVMKDTIDSLQAKIAEDTKNNGQPDPNDQMHLMSLSAQYQSALASQQSAQQQLDSAFDQAVAGIDQIDDGLESMAQGKEDLQKAMDDLESQMRYSSAYQALAIVQLQSAIDLMEKNLELVDKSIAIYELQKKLGMTTDLNVDTQKVSKAELEKNIKDNQEQLDNLKRSLNKLIGRDAATPLEVVPMQLPIAIEAAPEYTGKLVDKFIGHDTTLRDLERNREDLKDSVTKDMGSDERQDIDYQVEGVDMKIDTQRQAVADNVKAMLAKINSDGDAYKISRQKYVNEQKNFEIAQKKYELGMISQVQLMQAEATLAQAELTNMQNGYAFYFDWAKYNLASQGIDTGRLP